MTTLAELCTSIDYGYTASASDDPAAGPKFLRITDIVPDWIDWSTVPHCEIEDGKRDKFLLDEGDIVVARTGATVGYAKQIWARPEGATFASYLVRFRPDPEKVDPCFLGQIVQSPAFKKWVKSVAGGAAQPNANATLLGSFDVPLLAPEAQRQVGQALRTVEGRLENNRRRVEILEEMARLIYREWFVRFRFPGHEDVELVDSDLGLIPEGWNVLPIGEVAHIAYGRMLPKKVMGGGDTPVYGAANIIGSHDEANIDEPTIVMGCRGTCGQVAIAEAPAFITNNSFTIMPHFSSDQMWLFSLLDERGVEEFIGGSAQPQITLSSIKGLRLVVPPLPLRASFFHLASPMYSLRQNLMSQSAVLSTARDLLLPRLVSGDLDVSSLDSNLDSVV